MKYIINCFAFVLLLTVFNCKSLPAELKALEGLEIFHVSEAQTAIVLDGVINSSALDRFKNLHQEYPYIKKLKIINCDGSINDEINLELAQYIHQNGFDIHLEANGLIASGGTDLFLAGHQRTKGPGTKIGVHSWAGNSKTATDFPKEHKYHLPYIKYYTSVGFTQQAAEDFYYFTINAASADTIHWMTEEEIKRYGILSK